MVQELRLNCTRCGSFNTYYRKDDDPETVVRCDDCGKRHSTDSVFMVDPNRRHDRDESGQLVDTPY
jgi:uncharacterized Zn finger protein